MKKIRELIPALSPKDIVLFGVGRSGTTWLGQLLASAGLEYVFEPEAYWNFLPHEETRDRKRYPMPHHYLRAGQKTPYDHFFTKALRGEYKNEETVRANPGAKRKVIKVIRMNLMIPWILERVNVQPVYLMRDPMATIASQVSCDFETTVPRLTSYFYQDELFEDHLEPFRDLIEQADSSKGRTSYIEYLTILWCVQTYVARRQGVFDTVHTIRYRMLLLQPYKLLWDIANRFSLDFNFEALDREIAKKSFTTHSLDENHDPLNNWRNVFSDDEVKLIVDIIKVFGLAEYIGSDDLKQQ